jgi:hypothetical protein
MTLPHIEADKLARSILTKQRIGGIWRLHQAAAAAHRAEFPQSAADLIEVAEAAEEAWTAERECCLRGGLADLVASFD